LPRGQRQKFYKKNLVFLSHGNPYLQMTKSPPEGLALDLVNGTWDFERDAQFGKGPFKIGRDTRYYSPNHKWGPIGVYDITNFDHIKAMAHQIQNACRCCNDSY